MATTVVIRNRSSPNLERKTQKSIARFLSEMYALTSLKRSGWRRYHVPEEHQDSIAEHTAMADLIGYLLATLYGLSPKKRATVVEMLLFHDTPESRVGDIDWLARRYLEKDQGAKEALKDQTSRLPKEIKAEILELHQLMEGNSLEATLARDADLLEAALRAKILEELGFDTKQVIKNCLGEIKTEIAKQLLETIMEEKKFLSSWFDQLKLKKGG